MTYSNVRPETHITREYLIHHLDRLPEVADIWDDGTDLVVVTFRSGEKVQFYLVDAAISVHEIQKTLANNMDKGMATLFLFWADMLLPNDGERFIPDEWMQAMLALYGDKIYGYEVSSTEVFLFPVYFELQNSYAERYIRWGKTVLLKNLRPHILHLESVHLRGQFRLGTFDPFPHQQTQGENDPRPHSYFAVTNTLQGYYTLLNLSLEADPETIRQAYRTLARQYHPDLNPSPEAHEKMQALNQAYAQIMAQFEV